MVDLVAPPAILVSQVGYSLGSTLPALLVTSPGDVVSEVFVHTVAHRGAQGGAAASDVSAVSAAPVRVGAPESVAGWSTAVYRRLDLSAVDASGTYVVHARVDDRIVSSEPFVVAPERLQAMTIADVTAYFRSQRSSGEIDRKDARARFYQDPERPSIDARGGWLDASGDTSKFLSHLTYTSMMSPQQIPLCAWALLGARDELVATHGAWSTSQRARLRDEGLFGADFLVRFQDPSGFFYTGIFDALTKQLDERVITAPLQNSVRTQRWQAAYRHGGGLAIAALARASTAEAHGDFDSATYFDAARRGFEHLEEHNAEYLFDGRESVIDDYCALLGATELMAASKAHGQDPGIFSQAARARARSLADRFTLDENGVGHLVGDADGRPFFHAAEPGLPVVALLRYAECVAQPEESAAAETLALALLQATLQRIDAAPNPFGLLRQRVQPTDAAPRDSFFYPHDNETGYWWQGENAGLASMAYAATLGARLASCPEPLRARLRRLTDDLLAWITGLNPFDVCMLQGRGRGAMEYSGEYQNSPGGILNGVTSGFHDESGIALDPADAPDGEEWRWAEQWIPHSGWFVLAVAAAP
jgi:hypothetical protein